MIRRFLEIPFFVWIIIAGALAGKDYYEWNRDVNEPLDAARTARESELSSLKIQSQRIEEFKKKKQEKLAQLQELGEKFRATSDRLPRASSVPELLKNLADIGDRSGLEFSRFSPGAARKDQFLVITPVDISLRGTYVQIMSFLDATSHITRVVSPGSVIMENPQSRGPVNILSATVNLLTFHIEDTGGG